MNFQVPFFEAVGPTAEIINSRSMGAGGCNSYSWYPLAFSVYFRIPAKVCHIIHFLGAVFLFIHAVNWFDSIVMESVQTALSEALPEPPRSRLVLFPYFSSNLWIFTRTLCNSRRASMLLAACYIVSIFRIAWSTCLEECKILECGGIAPSSCSSIIMFYSDFPQKRNLA